MRGVLDFTSGAVIVQEECAVGVGIAVHTPAHVDRVQLGQFEGVSLGGGQLGGRRAGLDAVLVMTRYG